MARNGIRNYAFLQNSFNEVVNKDVLDERIAEADILCVGGGSTQRTLTNWNELEVRETILDRVKEGSLVASGGSAGAMIWFDRGYSDGDQYIKTEGQKWDYKMVDGLGLIPAWITAHHSDVDSFGRLRSERYLRTLRHNSAEWDTAFGLDRAAALVCMGSLATIISLEREGDTPGHTVHRYRSRNGVVSKSHPISHGIPFHLV